MNAFINNPNSNHPKASNQKQTMKTIRNLWMALSVALVLATPFIGRGDDVPGVINYQGRLTDTLGNPVASGYYEIKFLVWDDAVQNGAANLIWGRTFALHVVQDGLFNVQLSDGGSLVTQPSTPITNQLLGAFEGPRWLGLTIAVSNNVPVSGSEISPRQQLATAPFALQAQTANAVVTGGIQDAMLQSESVTTPKIATGAVTTDKIGDSQVTTAKIGDNQVTTAKIGDSQVTAAKLAGNAVATGNIQNGAVTSAKLNVDGDLHLNDHALYLRGDQNHGLKYAGTFAGANYDGPALFGSSSGVLGTTSGGQKAALSWGSDQSVTVVGTLSVEGGSTSFGSVKVLNLGTAYTAPSDGFVTFHAYHGHAFFKMWDASGTLLVQGDYFYSQDNADSAWFTMPVAKGEHFQWAGSSGGVGGDTTYWWRSIGKNVGNPASYTPPQ